ncbi:hypothetical protein FACS1894172_01890 [Spirochaetia bacterium]|nr:hypothetical protein FACS1894172_01890 [Spirochaetia bacterium]
MNLLSSFSGRNYQLESKAFNNGGEGEIFNILNYRGYIAKIYRTVSKEKEMKLLFMHSKRPSQEILSQIAWPLDILYDNDRFCGFVANKLNTTGDLSSVYAYPPVQKIPIRKKVEIARNICSVIDDVHQPNYIFGDFNPRNIGVNIHTGTVAFFDTDSYHIILDKRFNAAYRCNVCLDGYVAPELLKKFEHESQRNPAVTSYADLSLDTFTKETDNFALAIHIFRLLMNGYTPFNGIKENASVSQASPGIGNEAIIRDAYCFKPGNKPQAVAVPPLSILPPYIRLLFSRAFIGGKKYPHIRPDADEWNKALYRYEKSLKSCKKDSSHQYFNVLSSCPWCEADTRYKNAITSA